MICFLKHITLSIFLSDGQIRSCDGCRCLPSIYKVSSLVMDVGISFLLGFPCMKFSFGYYLFKLFLMCSCTWLRNNIICADGHSCGIDVVEFEDAK